MSHTPLLTVIVPVYNVESYLPQCLESICNYDNRAELEIVLVDDGSTDSSPEICKSYESTYENIKYIRQTNKGLPGARNTGIRKSTGKYLLFLDSDDYLKEGILNRIIDDIENYDVDIFFGRAYNCIDERQELSQVDYERYSSLTPAEAFIGLDSRPHFWFAAWLVLIRREFLIDKDLFFKEGILHEDELWVPSVFIEAGSIRFLNYGFYCYRTNRPGSIVSRPNIKREFDKIVVADELTKRISNNPLKNKIIHRRRASLIFGILIRLSNYKAHNDYKLLQQTLRSHVKYIRYRKYLPLYFITKIIGVKLTAKIFANNG